MNKLAFISFAILFVLSSCEKDVVNEDVEYISYGISFGECLGYCIREVIVDEDKTEFTKSGWDMEGALPDSSCSQYFFSEPYPLYSSHIQTRNPLPDFLNKLDQITFKNMDNVIGCPDCADGGSEWLELGFEGDVKRVTFEYMNEPDELKDIIVDLRGLMDSFNDCR